MLYKLLRFVILSRFSKQLLALMLVLLIYALFISSTTSGMEQIYYYYGPPILSLFLVLPILSGGIAVLKSDRDFLFTLPVKRSELALSLFIVQLLSFSLVIVYILAFSFSSLKPVFFYALIDFIGLILAVTSLGPVTYTLRLGWRVLFAFVFALWPLSAYLGFPYTPAAIYTGHPAYAVVTSVILAAVTVPFAFRSLYRVDLDLMRTFTRYSSGDVKHVRRFSGMSPMNAIYAENYFIVEASGRMNMMGGGSSHRSGRFKLSKGIVVTSALAAAYYYVFNFGMRISLQYQELIIFMISIYSVVIIMFFTMGILGNERLWLGFMTRSPTRYLRDLLTAKSLSLATLLSPIAIASFLIAIQGNVQALSFGLLLLVEIPSLLVIVVYASAFLYPFQIREELMMPGQFNLRQMATLLPLLPVWLFVSLSFGVLEAGLTFLSLTITLLTTLLIAGIAITLMYSRSLGKKVIDSLVTAGFV